MDAATAEFYASHAQDVVRRYEAVESPVARYFATAFASGCKVLDVGSGSGRDLAALLALGYDAYGAEPVEAMASGAISGHPQLAGRIAPEGLPAIGEPFGGRSDGILYSAVLMHVPEGDLFDTAFALRNLLRPHGRQLISLPLSRGDVDGGERGLDGRYFVAAGGMFTTPAWRGSGLAAVLGIAAIAMARLHNSRFSEPRSRQSSGAGVDLLQG